MPSRFTEPSKGAIILDMDKIAVLIPCYNEELTIGKVVQDVQRFLPEATIYVYDNNSTDATAKIAAENGAIVRQEKKQGKGNVVRTMFREIDAECYLMIDGDDTYGLETAPEMVRRVLVDKDDMVIGDRLSGAYYKENKRAFHNFGNNLVRWFVNRLFHCRINDIMTGYRAFSYEFAKTFPVLSKGFEIETEMSIHVADKNLSFSEMTITYRDRPEGSFSKLRTFSDGFKVLKLIFKMVRKYRPSFFFGIIAFILIALGVGFVIPVFIEYFNTGEVANFPTLIVCGFAVLAGLISIFTGFTCERIREREMTSFEQNYIDASLDKRNNQ